MSRVLVVGNDVYRSTIEGYLKGSGHQVVSVGDEAGAMVQPLRDFDFFTLGVRFPLRSSSRDDSRALVLAQRLHAASVPYDKIAVVGLQESENKFLHFAHNLGITSLYSEQPSRFGNLSNLVEDINRKDESRKMLLEDINSALISIWNNQKLLGEVRATGKQIDFASYSPFPADYDGFGYLSIHPQDGLVANRVTVSDAGSKSVEAFKTRPNIRWLQLQRPDGLINWFYEVAAYMIGDPAYRCKSVSGKPGDIPKNFDSSRILNGEKILLSLERAIRDSH